MTLARSLYLVASLREAPQRLIVALTMLDVAARRAGAVDPAALEQALGVPVVALDPRRSGDADLARAVVGVLAADPPRPRPRAAGSHDDELALADDRFGWWVAAAVDAASEEDHAAEQVTRTNRIDRWVTSRWLGPLIFLAAMWAVFELTTSVAAPLQDALGRLFSGPVTGGLDRSVRR